MQHVARRAGVSDTEDSRTELLDYDLNDTHMNTHTHKPQLAICMLDMTWHDMMT